MARLRPRRAVRAAMPMAMAAVWNSSRRRNPRLSRQAMRRVHTGSAVRVGDHGAGPQADDAVAAPGQVGVVGDQHQGGARLLVQLEQQVGDRGAGVGVEVARRLVGEEDARPMDEGPRQSDALLLAAGKLDRVMAEAVAEADAVEQLGGALPGAGLAAQLQGARPRSPRRSGSESAGRSGTRSRRGPAAGARGRPRRGGRGVGRRGRRCPRWAGRGRRTGRGGWSCRCPRARRRRRWCPPAPRT